MIFRRSGAAIRGGGIRFDISLTAPCASIASLFAASPPSCDDVDCTVYFLIAYRHTGSDLWESPSTYNLFNAIIIGYLCAAAKNAILRHDMRFAISLYFFEIFAAARPPAGEEVFDFFGPALPIPRAAAEQLRTHFPT